MMKLCRLLTICCLLCAVEARAEKFGHVPPINTSQVLPAATATQMGFSSGAAALKLQSVTVSSSASEIVLRWDKVSGADSYFVYWSTTLSKAKNDNRKMVEGKDAAGKDIDHLVFSITPVQPNQTYHLAVEAIGAGGTAGEPYVATVTTPSAVKNLLTGVDAKLTSTIPKVTVDLANYCIAFPGHNNIVTRGSCFPLGIKTTQQVKNDIKKKTFADSFMDEDGGIGNIKVGYRKRGYDWNDQSTLTGFLWELNLGVKMLEGLTGKTPDDTTIYVAGQAAAKAYYSAPIFNIEGPLTIDQKAGALTVGVTGIGNYAKASAYRETFGQPKPYTFHLEGSAQLYITNVINVQVGGTLTKNDKAIDNRYFFNIGLER